MSDGASAHPGRAKLDLGRFPIDVASALLTDCTRNWRYCLAESILAGHGGSSREQLIEYLAESGLRVKTLEEKLRSAELESRYLHGLLRLARIEKYGSGSEKFSDEQPALLELEPGVSQAESERAQLRFPFRIREEIR